MIIHIPTLNALAASSYYSKNVFYIYRDSGEQVFVEIEGGIIKQASDLLTIEEVNQFLKYVLNGFDSDAFCEVESKMNQLTPSENVLIEC